MAIVRVFLDSVSLQSQPKNAVCLVSQCHLPLLKTFSQCGQTRTKARVVEPDACRVLFMAHSIICHRADSALVRTRQGRGGAVSLATGFGFRD